MEKTADRPRSRSLTPLAALRPFLAPYRGTLAAALVALLVAAAAMLAMPVAFRQLIDHGLAANDPSTINRYFLGFLAAALVFGAFAALRFYLVSWLGERVVADLRGAVYGRVVRMDPTFYEVTRTGEILSRLTTDTTLVQAIAGVNLSVTLRSGLNLIGGLIMLGLTSAKLMSIILVGIPLVVLPLVMVARRVRKLSRESQDRIADISSLADETLNAIQTVQAFTLEDLQSRRYGEAVEASFSVAVRRTRMRAWLTAAGTALVFGGITFVLWMGAHDVLAGRMTGGQLGQFLMYAGIVGIAAASLTEMWGEVQRAAGAMERIAELLRAEPALRAPQSAAPLPARISGAIDFESVSFRYPSRPESAALQDFTLAVRAGETVALVGPSGAGKSTVFNLLLRFYDADSGRIEIDGQDIQTVTLESLRAAIGVVTQEAVLFDESIAENIALGKPGATPDEIRAAARGAAAHDFIMALPEGYDTRVGENGLKLSGGQRQRIAIARAMLRNAPILLLDEATSALDTESERQVQEALAHLMEGRTTIVIAHRLSTVVDADRIYVLDKGGVAQSGTHAELMAEDGLYASLYRHNLESA